VLHNNLTSYYVIARENCCLCPARAGWPRCRSRPTPPHRAVTLVMALGADPADGIRRMGEEVIAKL